MKAILMSIHPVWCEKIFNGTKTIEVRKSRPKLETPFEVLVYCSKGQELWGNGEQLWKGIDENEDLETVFTLEPNLSWLNSKVIGSFICDEVKEFTFSNYEAEYRINHADLSATCLNYPDLIGYGKGKTLYGWHITEPKLYDTPKKLSEFRKPCVDKYEYCQGCKHGLITIPPDEEEYALYHGGYYEFFDTVCLNTVSRPPQSWCYVEVEK